MQDSSIDRRTILKGGAALASLSVVRMTVPAGAAQPDAPVEVIPWLDQPAPNPVPDIVGHPLVWESLGSWYTPNEEFFTVKHYNQPIIDPSTWELSIGGLVERPTTLSLANLRARRRHEVDFTLECSGNTGLPFFIGGIGNARWAGTQLAPILKDARPTEDAREVVFWGADAGEVSVTGGWSSGPGTSVTFTEQFARSMSLKDALASTNQLCYEMNGVPLPAEHGAPVRLIAPGWYGVANVKWLTRIELRAQRFAGRFMAREYVTIREEVVNGETVWTFETVGHDRLKSAPARVTRQGGKYKITGAAWGAPIDAVEVSIDGGPWRRATLNLAKGDQRSAAREGTAWAFWTLDWPDASPGEHRITCRAIDRDDNVQPGPSDPFLVAKRTFWESNGQITRRVRIT